MKTKLAFALFAGLFCHSLAMADCSSTSGDLPEGAQISYAGSTYVCSNSNWYMIANSLPSESAQPSQSADSSSANFDRLCQNLSYSQLLARGGKLTSATDESQSTIIQYGRCTYYIDDNGNVWAAIFQVTG